MSNGQTMSDDGPIEIYRAMGRAQAEIVLSFLESNGIEASMATEDAGGQYPMNVGHFGEVRIMVRPEDAEHAARAIRESLEVEG